MKTTFWTYFTSGYGILWLLLLGCSLITRSRIDAGVFGLFGFPVIALVYALIRRSRDSENESRQETIRRSMDSGKILRQSVPVISNRLPEFLAAHPEFANAPQRIRDASFQKWLGDLKT